MIYFLLFVFAYFVVGLFVSRWMYLKHHWFASGDIGWMILLWPVIVIGRPAAKFFRWFYKRPEVKE